MDRVLSNLNFLLLLVSTSLKEINDKFSDIVPKIQIDSVAIMTHGKDLESRFST